jgi:hypothetical protein
MHGVAEEAAVAGESQPVNMPARPMADNRAVKEGSFVFMFFLKRLLVLD